MSNIYSITSYSEMIEKEILKMVKNSICERSLRLALNRNGSLTGGLYKEYLEVYYYVHGEICKHSKKQLLAYLKEGGSSQ